MGLENIGVPLVETVAGCKPVYPRVQETAAMFAQKRRLRKAAPLLLEALLEAREQLAKEIGLPVSECVGAHFVKINEAIASATDSRAMARRLPG